MEIKCDHCVFTSSIPDEIQYFDINWNPVTKREIETADPDAAPYKLCGECVKHLEQYDQLAPESFTWGKLTSEQQKEIFGYINGTAHWSLWYEVFKFAQKPFYGEGLADLQDGRTATFEDWLNSVDSAYSEWVK